MLLSRFVVRLLMVGFMAAGVGPTSAQDFPNRPIHIITIGVGGGIDFSVRVVADSFSQGSLGRAVVENKSTVVIAAETVAKAPPDGYTVLYAGNGFWVGPFMQKVSYDPVRDFIPISSVARKPNVLIVHPSLPVKSTKDLIILAKAKPGQLNYGAGSIGASVHLAAELFKSMAGVNIVLVPFKNSGPALTALMGGELQVMFASTSTAAPAIKSGKVRGLAVSTLEPSPLAPGLPTIASTLPGYESASVDGIFLPAKTPAAIVKRLNEEVVRTLNDPTIKQQFFDGGTETLGATQEQFTAYIKSDMERNGKLVKDLNIHLD